MKIKVLLILESLIGVNALAQQVDHQAIYGALKVEEINITENPHKGVYRTVKTVGGFSCYRSQAIAPTNKARYSCGFDVDGEFKLLDIDDTLLSKKLPKNIKIGDDSVDQDLPYDNCGPKTCQEANCAFGEKCRATFSWACTVTYVCEKVKIKEVLD